MENSKELIKELKQIIQKCIKRAEVYKTMTLEQLNFKSRPEKWSVLECLEHLNLYGDFYIPEIGSQINSSKYPFKEQYKSGMLGRYFYNSMKVNDNQIKTMKTFNNMDPKDSKLPITIVERFINQQREFLGLLDKATSVDLTKTKTSISISKMIKLRMCDTLKVVIYHNERHVWQADKVIALL